jgi:hypothetical protein
MPGIAVVEGVDVRRRQAHVLGVSGHRHDFGGARKGRAGPAGGVDHGPDLTQRLEIQLELEAPVRTLAPRDTVTVCRCVLVRIRDPAPECLDIPFDGRDAGGDHGIAVRAR